jgi:hypothetical protein
MVDPAPDQPVEWEKVGSNPTPLELLAAQTDVK